ncbi:hypothetical protein QAD02_014088 [Eretmocerus hayati]|uniref:Uncharacterized protein n=1 Tax=Eretmocerus hayati TaxID=131215 RepID=A0ACC2P5I9_9HYME|nr:hypothetical protein QAD02_014088 [Eretmocerus hayati]
MLRAAKSLKHRNYAEKRKIIAADEEAKRPKCIEAESENFQVLDIFGDIVPDDASEALVEVENLDVHNDQSSDFDVQLQGQNHQSPEIRDENEKKRESSETELKGGYPILNIADDIKKYAQTFLIPYKQIDGLSEVLRPHHPTLPACSKTLMGRYSQKKHEVEVFPDGGEFVYFGISDHLKKIVNPKLHKNRKLKIQFNFDGIPLFKSSSRTFWPILGQDEPRTDESFRLQLDPDHHHDTISPLINIFPHIDMVYLFILDFMHLGCLGTTKKLLTGYWMKPSMNILSREQVMCLSQWLMNLSSQLPCEFQRTTRTLGEVAKWKATEFRFFLLYAGPLVLKGILSDLYYKHFLLFSVGSRILCSRKHYESHFEEAKKYLEEFAKLSSHEDLYGLKVLVNNMHNTFHLPDDVKNMGCPLSDISAFCFENLLGRIKKILQSGNRPLAELQNKLHDYCPDKRPDKPSEFMAHPAYQKNSKNGVVNLHKIEYKDSTLTVKSPNNVVQLTSGEILLIKSMSTTDPSLKNMDSVSLEGEQLNIMGPAFDYPGDSSVLNIYQVQKSTNAPSKQFTLRDVDSKMMMFDIFEVEEDEPEDMSCLFSTWIEVSG